MRLTSARVEAQSLDYVDLLVPGLLAMAIAQSAAFGVAFSLVAWRQKGMLRRLRLTPLPLYEFATARVVFHLMIAVVQAVILLTVGRVLFGVHLVGNVLALVPLVAARQHRVHRARHVHRRPRQHRGCDRGALEPDRPAHDVPRRGLLPARLRARAGPVIAHFLPLTYLAEGLQDVAVRGHSFTSDAAEPRVLALFAAALSALALRLFRWQTTT